MFSFCKNTGAVITWQIWLILILIGKVLELLLQSHCSILCVNVKLLWQNSQPKNWYNYYYLKPIAAFVRLCHAQDIYRYYPLSDFATLRKYTVTIRSPAWGHNRGVQQLSVNLIFARNKCTCILLVLISLVQTHTHLGSVFASTIGFLRAISGHRYNCGSCCVQVSGVGYSARGEVLCDHVVVQRDTHPSIAKVIEVGAVCNNAQIIEGNLQGQPTEGALLACAMKVGVPVSARNDSIILNDVDINHPICTINVFNIPL